MKKRKPLNEFIRGAFIIIGIMIILLVWTSLAKSDTDKQYIDITVRQGDTLWGYWNEYGTGRYDKWLYETKQLNGMDTAELQEGQILRVEVRE